MKPYDLKAEDPWVASGYDPRTLPKDKLQKPYRSKNEQQLTAEQLTLLWVFAPEWDTLCKSAKGNTEEKRSNWVKTAITAVLKHPVFPEADAGWLKPVSSLEREVVLYQWCLTCL